MRSRRTRAVTYLFVPALTAVALIGARRWADRNPLLSAAPSRPPGSADRPREYREPSPDLTAALLQDGDPQGIRATDAVPPALGSRMPGAGAGDPEATSAQLSASVSPQVARSTYAPDGGPGGRRLAPDVIAGTAPFSGSRGYRSTHVRAGERVVVLGDGTPTQEVLELVEELGPGQWEVDLRFRGQVVLREGTP